MWGESWLKDPHLLPIGPSGSFEAWVNDLLFVLVWKREG